MSAKIPVGSQCCGACAAVIRGFKLVNPCYEASLLDHASKLLTRLLLLVQVPTVSLAGDGIAAIAALTRLTRLQVSVI